MFRFFARLAVRRPVLTTMLVGILVFLGAFSYLNLGHLIERAIEPEYSNGGISLCPRLSMGM